MATWGVSAAEFITGAFLVVGLLSSLCALILIADMVVAILTVQLSVLPHGLSFFNWLDDFFYLPEVLYIVLLLWLMISGPSKLSIDYLLFGKYK